MKILILSDVQDHGKKCAEGLMNLGHNILYVYQRGAIDKCVHLNSKILKKELPFGGKVGYILNVIALRKIFISYKPDIVHIHYAAGYGLLSRLARVHPSIISCYGSDIFEFPNLNKFNYYLLRFVLSSANILQSTSYGMANEIQKVLGNRQTDIDVIPFGINVNLFKPEKKEKHTQFVIGIIKCLYPIYNISLLIHAFKIVRSKTILKPVLKIYGNGPEKENLQQIAKELGLSDSVYFMGGITNESVPKALNEMDVFVNCSNMESFGVNILEAMSCCIPVIATDCVGPREIIEDGVSGIILKERTPESLADAIIELLLNDELRKNYGEAGRKRVLKYYNWTNNVIQLEQSLKRVLK